MARGGPTCRGRMRGVSPGAVRSACPLLWRSHPRGVDVASRRTLEDPVEARRHPLGIVAVVIAIPTIIFTGGFFFRLPLYLYLAQRASSAWWSRFFFLFPFFSESLADFCFSVDRRRLSRSTSSSFTGGLEDRTSIYPCQNKGKFKEGSKEIKNQSHVQERNVPGQSSPHRASWGSR